MLKTLLKMAPFVVGVLMIVAAVVLGIYLSLFYLLYGGIMQAVNNWGVNNSLVVWGIIKAVFFEMGAIPAYLLGVLGIVVVGIGAALLEK